MSSDRLEHRTDTVVALSNYTVTNPHQTMAFEQTQDAQQKKPTSSSPTNKDIPWYEEDIPDISEPVRQLLEQYSGIPPERLKEQILSVVGFPRPTKLACLPHAAGQ